MSAIALAVTLATMTALQLDGPVPVQRELSALLPIVPTLAGGGVLLLLHPSGPGTLTFYAAAATVIPTALIAIAISGRLFAGRLHTGVDLFRVALGLYLVGDGEFTALRALYRGVGARSDVTTTVAGLVAATATVFVAALVTEFALA